MNQGEPMVQPRLRDPFTEAMFRLDANPEALHTRTVVREVGFLGITETWIVETWKAEGQFTIALEKVGNETVRIIIPPAVSSLMFGHADRLNKQVSKRAGRKAAETRKARV